MDADLKGYIMKKTIEQQLLESLSNNLTNLWEDWNKVNHHDHTNGLSQKAVNAYRREHPGSKLKTAVTTKPSKLKPGSKAAKRRKSFCARMSGNKGPMKKPNGKPTPKALALRRWNCESIEEMQQMIIEGEKMIAKLKQQYLEENWSQKYKNSINCSHPKGFSQKAHCAGKKKHNESHDVMEMVCEDCGMCKTHGDMSLQEIAKGAKDSNGYTKCWPSKHAEGTKKGKNGGQVRNCVPNEGVAEDQLDELSSELLQKAAQSAKNKMNQAMEPELHNALGGGYMNPLAKYYDDLAQKFGDKAVQVGKKETIQQNKIASPAVMRKLGMPAPAAKPATPAAPGVVEGGSRQAAIAIAKRESGKYTKDGKRKK